MYVDNVSGDGLRAFLKEWDQTHLPVGLSQDKESVFGSWSYQSTNAGEPTMKVERRLYGSDLMKASI